CLGHISENILYANAKQLVQRYRLEKRKAPVLDFDVPKSKSVTEILKNIFRNYEGFCLGEDHRDLATKDFLKEHMAELKKMGVNALFVEGVPLGAREAVEQFNAGKENIPWT